MERGFGRFAVSCAALAFASSGCAWISRASVSTGGAESHPAGRAETVLDDADADGRFVVFTSDAPDLVPGDTNAAHDVFIRDGLTGTVERVSVASGGDQADAGSSSGAVSGDGRYVAFVSEATNLVAGDTNGFADIFLRDRTLGTTARVNTGVYGAEANDVSYSPRISADAKWVLYTSWATNIVSGDTNYSPDVFLLDRSTGQRRRVSTRNGGGQSDYGGDFGDLSDDGNYIVFSSESTNIVAGDGEGIDVYLRDRANGGVSLVSNSEMGWPADEDSDMPVISGDGRYVAFHSDADLIASDGNGWTDVYVWDRVTASLELASVASDGSLADQGGMEPSISDDGRFVAFESYSTNLTPESPGDDSDVFVHDRVTGETNRASESILGGEAISADPSFSGSFGAVLSGDGRKVAFTSFAENLVPGDTNSSADVFTREVLEPVVTGVAPPAVAAGGSATITVSGKHFVDGATVMIDGTGGITVDSVTFVSAEQLDVQVHASPGSTAGSYSLFVLNPTPLTAVPGGPYGAGAACWGCVAVTP